MKVLVLTSCVKTKEYDPRKEPVKSALDRNGLPPPNCDLANEERYRLALKDFILPARRMYLGSFLYIKRLVDELRGTGNDVDLHVISARYGLIEEDKEIIPYECTFQGLPKNEIRRRASDLGIFKRLNESIGGKVYDWAIIVLGRNYILTILDKESGLSFLDFLKTEKLTVMGARSMKEDMRHPNLDFRVVKGLRDRNTQIQILTNQIVETYTK